MKKRVLALVRSVTSSAASIIFAIINSDRSTRDKASILARAAKNAKTTERSHGR